MSKLKITITLVLALVIGIIVAGCTVTGTAEKANAKGKTQLSENPNKRGTQVGELAPDFELPKTKGGKVSLESLKGNPAVLVFWSAYCVDCEDEAPHINKLAKEFEPKGVKVVGINVGESEARTLGGIKDFGIEYDVARDEGRKITQEYKVIGTPTVIFLDKKGVVKYNANKLPEDYAKQLNTLIG